jgi:hypothetical protein
MVRMRTPSTPMNLDRCSRACFSQHRIKSRADALANRSLPDTVAPRKRDVAFSATEREPHASALLVQSDGGFFMPGDNVIRSDPIKGEVRAQVRAILECSCYNAVAAQVIRAQEAIEASMIEQEGRPAS